MKVTSYQGPGLALDSSEASLQWFLTTTELAVDQLVQCFQTMAGRIEFILGAASQVVAQMDDAAIDRVRRGIDGLGDAVNQLVSERKRVIDEILQAVVAEGELLRQLSTVTEGQAKIALTIKALTVHTKIEIGHLGESGVGFDYLAHELEDFSRSLAQGTDELARETEHRWVENGRARALLSNELPALCENMARMESHLRQDLSALHEGLGRLALLPHQFRVSAEGISRDIADVVVAFQAQDITRQQIEHVRDALKLLSAVNRAPAEFPDVCPEEVAQAYAGVLIQIAQLRSIEATISSWISQIRHCTENIFSISGSDVAAIGPLVLDRERTMAAHLADIERIEQTSTLCGGNISETLSGISSLSQLVIEELKTSEFARNRLRMLTFNSVIEAYGLGNRADTICVIADGIAEVSAEWTHIAQQSGRLLQDILTLSDNATAGIRSLSSGGDERLEQARHAASEALQQLRAIAACTEREGETISDLTQRMQTESETISATCDLLDTCFQRMCHVQQDLEELRAKVEERYPGVGSLFDADEAERQFAGSYTTQSERNVLRAALQGTVVVCSPSSLAGNDVELF